MLKPFMFATPLLVVFVLACSDDDTSAGDEMMSSTGGGEAGDEMMSSTGGTEAEDDDMDVNDFCYSGGIGVMVPKAEEACSDGEGGYLPCRSPCEPDCEDDECSAEAYVCDAHSQCVPAP